jgi:type II secretory pathway predicted ATPase ExeA
MQRGAFFRDFMKDTGVQFGKTTFLDLLSKGNIPKRIPRFKEIMEDYVARKHDAALRAMRMTPADIWNPIPTLEDVEDDGLVQKARIMTEVEMLTDKAMKHFKLRENPFSNRLLNAKEMYMGANHMFALEVMKSVALTGGFAVVTGQVGSGKSTVRTRFFAESKHESYRIVFVKSLNKKMLNARSILHAIIYDLSEREPKGNEESLVRQVEKLLLASYQNNEKVVVVIEESQDLTVDMLKILKRLYELDDGEYNRLVSIILIGQNELENRLYRQNTPELREVSARTTHARLEPLEEDVKKYIEKRLANIGAKTDAIITAQALDELVKRMRIADRGGKTQAMTYPLYINTIMQRLMNEAARSGEEIITPEIIMAVGL